MPSASFSHWKKLKKRERSDIVVCSVKVTTLKRSNMILCNISWWWLVWSFNNNATFSTFFFNRENLFLWRPSCVKSILCYKWREKKPTRKDQLYLCFSQIRKAKSDDWFLPKKNLCSMHRVFSLYKEQRCQYWVDGEWSSEPIFLFLRTS